MVNDDHCVMDTVLTKTPHATGNAPFKVASRAPRKKFAERQTAEKPAFDTLEKTAKGDRAGELKQQVRGPRLEFNPGHQARGP